MFPPSLGLAGTEKPRDTVGRRGKMLMVALKVKAVHLPGSSMLPKNVQRQEARALARVDAQDERYCTIGRDMNFHPCS